jgi:chromosome segregation ATPase
MSAKTDVNPAAGAIEARRRRTEQMLGRIRTALRHIHNEHARITVQAVARRAGVSRSFLYQNPEARRLIEDATARAGGQHARTLAHEDAAAEAVWRERALNAEAGLKAAHQEIRTLRARTGELLGQIRDLELDLPADALQRLASENTTLRDQLRQRNGEIKTLTERLSAARANNRSQGAEIANLQAQLLDQPDFPATSDRCDASLPPT